MTKQTVDILFGLIKFDMNQIQNYREAIFNVSAAIVAAAFGISAFIYRKDCVLNSGYKAKIIVVTNVLLILATAVVAYHYQGGLHASRGALEMREEALQAHLFEGQPLIGTSLYPEHPEQHKNNMSSTLEKIPLYLAMAILGIKAIIEGMLLSKACVDKTAQEKPTDAS